MDATSGSPSAIRAIIVIKTILKLCVCPSLWKRNTVSNIWRNKRNFCYVDNLPEVATRQHVMYRLFSTLKKCVCSLSSYLIPNLTLPLSLFVRKSNMIRGEYEPSSQIQREVRSICSKANIILYAADISVSDMYTATVNEIITQRRGMLLQSRAAFLSCLCLVQHFIIKIESGCSEV
jgi:hypothetical protein